MTDFIYTSKKQIIDSKSMGIYKIRETSCYYQNFLSYLKSMTIKLVDYKLCLEAWLM